jgi:hypothetical protein
MAEESSVSEMVAGDLPADERFTWSALVVENGVGPTADVAPDADEPEPIEEPGEREEPPVLGEVVVESLALDLPGLDLAAPEPADEQPVGPSSDRAAELEGEHWRERAIVWRERAMAAELVAKMLQRNLDDLRANLEDLRLKVESAAADAQRTAAIASSESPWRRFAREMYAKYLG